MHASTPGLFFYLSFAIASVLAGANKLPGLPSPIYGVNLGSWLVIEPWMHPDEWVRMGGEICSNCSACISTEFAFAQHYAAPAVDATFKNHWETWFTQDHVNQLAGAGINTVRIPLGYWIVEALVNRDTEFYPRGGILHLQRGLAQLKEAGIAVILDHHGVPGVSYPDRVSPGRCVGASDIQFYTPYNYHRALIWTAVMTALSHVDPNFGTVAALQAVNQPIRDATHTPGLGQFEKEFVQTMRAVEYSLGVPNAIPGLISTDEIRSSADITKAIATTAGSSAFTPQIRQVLQDAIPMIEQITSELNVSIVLGQNGLRSSLSTKSPLVANFMEVNWQNNSPFHPADIAIGPQAYDDHIYYRFGGVTAPNEEAYLTSVCNLKHIKSAAALGNGPLWVGEWSLATEFEATDEFLKKWADAQKFSYGKDAGWLVWSFRIDDSATGVESHARQWSYLEGLRLGYHTQDPSQFNDPHVCDAYIGLDVAAGSSSA